MEVDPDIFFSLPVVLDSSLLVVESVLEVSLGDSFLASECGSGEELRPPIRIAAPVPISRFSFLALHLGQVRFTESLIP